MILISGATGGIGGEICRLLGHAGTPFRAMARQQAQVDAFQKKGTDAVLGDFDGSETLQAAMRGIDTMFLITPPNRRQFEQEIAAIDAARQAGVRRIAKLSASDAYIRSTVPWAQTHARIDHHLRASRLEWTS
jgi:uncharacterized protein YbjT (DUF2867 family)